MNAENVERAAWARAMIRRATGLVPTYGSRAWLSLPDGPERVAAVVIAAECKATDDDNLAENLAAELLPPDVTLKQIEDAAYTAQRDAWSTRWNHRAPGLRPHSQQAAEVEHEFATWAGGA